MSTPDSADFNEANHDGRLFTSAHIFRAVTAGADVYVHLATGAHKVAVAIQVVADGKVEFLSYGGATYSNLGTELGVFNRNSLDAYPAFSGKVYHTPAISGAGVQRLNLMIAGGGNSATAVGSISSDDIKTFLPPNADVLVKLTNKMAQAQDISVVVNLSDRI